MKFRILGLYLLIVGQFAFAGGQSSGGGTGYQMPDGSVHLLDTYEASLISVNLDLGDPGLPIQNRLDARIDQLAKVLPARAAMYKAWASSFFQEVQWIGSGQAIDNPSDLGGVIFPSGAKIVQLCFQRSGPVTGLPGEQRYVIDKGLYNQLSSEDQIALIMHELVYRDLMTSDNATAVQARYITEQLLRADLNWHVYVALMGRGLFPMNEFLGIMEKDPRSTVPMNSQQIIIRYFADNSGCQYDLPIMISNFPADIRTAAGLVLSGYLPSQMNIVPENLNNYGTVSGTAFGPDQEYCKYTPPFLKNPNLMNSDGTFYFFLSTGSNSDVATAMSGPLPISTNTGNFSAQGHFHRLVDRSFALLPETVNELDPKDKDLIFKVEGIDDLDFTILSNDGATKKTIRISGPAQFNYPTATLATGVFSLEWGGIVLPNGTGFSSGMITIVHSYVNSKEVWSVKSLHVGKASNLPVPKVGDVVFSF